MRKCALEAAQAACYIAHGHAHFFGRQLQLQHRRCSCRWRQQQHIIILWAAPKSGKTFCLAATAAAFLFCFFFHDFFFFSYFCHRQRHPKEGNRFSTRCTFQRERRLRFHYISFHSFIPSLAAFIHFGLGDLIRLSTLSLGNSVSQLPLRTTKQRKVFAASRKLYTLTSAYEETNNKLFIAKKHILYLWFHCDQICILCMFFSKIDRLFIHISNKKN